MKKLAALLLAIIMVGTLAVSTAEEKVSLTAFQYALENQNTDFNDLWYFDMIEEQTGVHVDFRMVKDADWNTQVNLMFATPDSMDDMILRNSVDVEDYGVSQGLLLPLDEYLTEEIMPNYVSRLGMNDINASIPASDGKSYFIGYVIAQNVNHEPTWYINTAKLNELGLEVPTTIEEYTNVLRAFKEAGITYPLSGDVSEYGAESWRYMLASFGVPINYNTFLYIDENDKVVFSGDAAGFRASMEWMHELYAEGLLDPETITQDSNTWANKVNNGDVGAFNYLRLINTALTPETAANYTAILPPVAEGCKVAVPMVMELPSAGAYLTSTNKDPVASLKWLDAQLETENMFVAQNGKMGEQLKVNDSGLYEVISVPENNGLYDFVPVSMGQFFGPGDYMTSNYQMAPHRIERYEDSKAYADAGVLEAKSFWYLTTLSKMNNDDAVEAANICTEIRKFMDETMVDFIKNGVTDESFATFQNNAKSLQVERYVALYQAAYDAYLAK